jgi:6-phosphofructokinase 1
MADRGENCLIAVAGHPTTVTNSAIAGIIDEAARGDYAAEIFGAGAGLQNLSADKLIDLGAQKRKFIEGLRRTPGSILPGAHSTEIDATAAIETLRAQNIGTVFVLGSLPGIQLLRALNDAAQAASYSLVALGVPLSAENDVAAGDHTPGYGSAARFAAGTARDAGRAAASGEEPLLVVEFLGQQSGWLAAASALGRDATSPAPHAVLVPERAVNLEALTDELRRACGESRGRTVARCVIARGDIVFRRKRNAQRNQWITGCLCGGNEEAQKSDGRQIAQQKQRSDVARPQGINHRSRVIRAQQAMLTG